MLKMFLTLFQICMIKKKKNININLEDEIIAKTIIK